MMYRSSVIAILVTLGLSVNVALAVICFEGTPLDTFFGTFYRFSGEESDGQICVNVRREEGDVNMFDFESFRYVVSEVATPIFGGATAAEGADFTPTPSGGSSVSFPENSTVTELCVDVILDDCACENPEDFRIRLISRNPAIITVCNSEAIVTIRDSTTITVGFTTSTTSVREHAPGVSLSVTRSSRIQNFNIAALSVMEDPNQGGCIAAPGRIQYPCIAPRCLDGTTTDLTQDVVRSVTLSLVPDDSEIDGHRECRVLLRPPQGSMCIFNITRGSTQLRVMDDEVVFLRFDEDFYEEAEDKGGVNVTVEMIGSGFVPITASGPVDFNLRIVGGTQRSAAEVGVDIPDSEYNSSVPPGQTSTSVRILFNPDDVYEQTETFELVLTPSTRRYNMVPASPFRADVQIANDDKVTVRFPQNLTVLESDGEISFSLSIAEQYEGEICFILQTRVMMDAYILDGNVNAATAGEDFESTKTNICFRNNSRTSDEFTVNILGAAANIPECDEVFSVKLDLPQEANPEMIEIPENSATVTIIDNSDIKISFEESLLTVNESVGLVELRLVADKVVERDLWINLSTQDGTAKSGSDYILLNQSARFPSNSRISDPALVQIFSSSCFELTERFSISLKMSCPGVIQGRYLNLTIIIKDNNVINVQFLVENVTKREGKLVRLTVARSGCIAQNISIGVLTNSTSGNASKDEDYRLRTREITFRRVNRVKEKTTVVVKLLKDGNPEPQESFYVFLSTLNGVVYDRQHVQVLIKDKN